MRYRVTIYTLQTGRGTFSILLNVFRLTPLTDTPCIGAILLLIARIYIFQFLPQIFQQQSLIWKTLYNSAELCLLHILSFIYMFENVWKLFFVSIIIRSEEAGKCAYWNITINLSNTFWIELVFCFLLEPPKVCLNGRSPIRKLLNTFNS